MSDHYILHGREIVSCDLLTWARWFETGYRVVAATNIGAAKVSTVFLGLDHSFAPGAKPVLFETMVFGGRMDGEQERYCTYDEAEVGHAAMVDKVHASNWLPDERLGGAK